MALDFQKFSENDTNEEKVKNVIAAFMDAVDEDLDSFWEFAFTTYGLGQVLRDTSADPVSKMLILSAFLRSFKTIHESYQKPGTYNFYLDIFRKIWGETVAVEFTNPAPGVLLINLDATDFQQEILLARDIVDGQYVFPELVTTDTGENIIVRVTITPWTEIEVLKLMRALAPAWLYYEVSLEDS
jgi:hypothetical protein